MPSTMNKTQGISVLAWQDIATGAVVLSAAQDVSTKFSASFFVQLGRNSGSAFTSGWPNIRIEASAKVSGDDTWTPVTIFQPAVGASIAATTLNGAISAGASSCVVTSAANIAIGDMLFLGHTTTPANYELVRVKGVSGTTITFEEACTKAHDNTAVVSDQAERYTASIDVSSYGRLRVVVDNANSARTIYVAVDMVTGDSVS